MIVALVDDNEEERNKTLPLLMQGFHDAGVPIARVDFFSDGESFLNHWELGSYDLIVLDIVMGEITGIDVAREIRRRSNDVRIVFCSTSNEYAYESYCLNASYYIQKPVNKDNITEMIQRLNISDFELRRFIILPNNQKLILRNMIYSEYSNHSVQITQKSGDPIKLWISQSQFLNLLEPYDFFALCNKGTIINLYEVTQTAKDTFTMSDGSIIPITRRKQKELEEVYHQFLFHTTREELF